MVAVISIGLRHIRRALAWAVAAAVLSFFCLSPWLRCTLLQELGIKPERKAFADAWVIAAGASALDHGLDPLRENPDDPWGRPMNYPQLVAHLVSSVGLTTRDSVAIGTVFAFTFIFSSAVLFRGSAGGATLVLTAALWSPAVFFALERGNLDLLIFAALCLSSCAPAAWVLPACTPLLCSLKLYPGFICAQVFLPVNRRLWLLAGLVCAAYGVWIWRDLPLIYSSTPRQPSLSWGVLTLPFRLHHPEAVWASWVIAVAALILGFLWGRLRKSVVCEDVRIVRLALCGALIFAACFFLGTNFNYRRIFLLMLLPFLLAKAPTAAPAAHNLVFGRLIPGAVLLALWSPSLVFWSARLGLHGGWLLDEVSVWLALSACAYVVARARELSQIPSTP